MTYQQMLQQILQKRAQGIKLTGKENRIWEDHLRTHLLKRQEMVTADRDGNVTIRHSMDVEPVFEGVRMMSQSQLHSPVKDAHGRTYLGSIDPITAVNWAKECGHPLYSKEWREFAKKRLMDRDFAKFRADNVRRYA